MLNDNDDEDDIATVCVNSAVNTGKSIKKTRTSRIALLRMRNIIPQPHARIYLTNFVETVWRYPDIQFQEDFRMNRAMFEVLRFYILES